MKSSFVLRQPSPTKQLYVGVGAVVDDGTVLFVRRRSEAVPEYDQKWELPGGKIEIGEVPEVAIEREVREETGLDVDCIDLAPFSYSKTIPIDGVATHVVVFCARCIVRERSQKGPTDREGLDPAWLRFEQIPFDRVIPGSREFALWCLRKAGWDGWSFNDSVYELDLARPSINKRLSAYHLRIDYTDAHENPFKLTRRWGHRESPTAGVPSA